MYLSCISIGKAMIQCLFCVSLMSKSLCHIIYILTFDARGTHMSEHINSPHGIKHNIQLKVIFCLLCGIVHINLPN